MKSNISWFSPVPRQWEGLDYRYERFHFLIEQRDHYELGTIYELVIQNSHDDTYGITVGQFGAMMAAQYAAERFTDVLHDILP